MRNQGVSSAGPLANISMFDNHFALPFAGVLITQALVVGLAFVGRDTTARRVIFLLSSMACLHMIYWIFISVGWPRYALSGIFYYASALASVGLLMKSRSVAIVLAAAFIAVHMGRIADLTNLITATMEQGVLPSAHQQALADTANFAASLPQGRLLSGSWATTIDVEYAMPRVGNFVRFDHATDPGLYYLVVNTILTSGPLQMGRFRQFS